MLKILHKYREKDTKKVFSGGSKRDEPTWTSGKV